MKRATWRWVGIVVLMGICTSARAAIVSSTGSVQLVPVPTNSSLGNLESNTAIFAFDERQGVLLGTELNIDIGEPGTFGPLAATLSPATIPSGARISSYYVHSDPVGTPGSGVFLSGSITLDEDVLGLITRDGNLQLSNAVLGLAGTVYSNEGVDLENATDSIVLSANRRTVSFSWATIGGGADFMRVVTVANVPEPSTGLLLAAGMFGLTRYYRGRPPIQERYKRMKRACGEIGVG